MADSQEYLIDTSASVRYVRRSHDGRAIADLVPGEYSVSAEVADLVVRRLPGWQVNAEPALGRLLLDRGATTARHAHTLAASTSDAPNGWGEAQPRPGLQVVAIDVDTLDPLALVPSNLAAYPPGHPDHEPDVNTTVALLVLMLGGDILGPLLPESALVVDDEGVVVAGLVVNRLPGQSPHGGPWVSDVWRDPRYPGLGSVLLKRALVGLRERGEPFLTLTVTDGNPAQGRYQRLGFVPAVEELRVVTPAGDVAADGATAEEFYWETWQVQAESVTAVDADVMVVRDRTFPLSFAHNSVFARRPVPAARLLDVAERYLADTAHSHIGVLGDLAAGEVTALVAAGYEHQPCVLMARRVNGDEARDPRVSVVSEAALHEWQVAATRQWRPNGSDAEIADLIGRRVLLDRGSTAVRLAARADGQVVGSVDLLVRGSVAEVDALGVAPEFRQTGLGDALLGTALAEAAALHVQVVVLTALVNDWPREWYARRGFAPTSPIHGFLREGVVCPTISN